jgi:alpha-tubulin suppressor-like RCC1 family protein
MNRLRLLRIVPLSLFIGQLWQTPAGCADSPIVAWGLGPAGQTNVPPGLTNVVCISAGGDHALALKGDGTVMAWGTNSFGQTNIPAGVSGAAAIAAGYSHNMVLRNDGTVTAWGANNRGQTNVPAGLNNVVSIAAGGNHNLALTGNGAIAGWGSNLDGQTNAPSDLKNVVALAAGQTHSLALHADGHLTTWGSFALTDIPVDLTNVVALAAGDAFTVALTAEGMVRVFTSLRAGFNAMYYAVTNVPAGLSNVVAIAASRAHAVALKSNGKVVCWGSSLVISAVTGRVIVYSATNTPAGLSNVVAISAGDNYSVALAGGGPPVITPLPQYLSAAYLSTVYLRAQAVGAFPLNYQWQFDGENIPEATNALLTLASLQLQRTGRYSVVASNSLGLTTNSGTWLDVLPIALTSQPQAQQSYQGGNVSFSATAASPLPVHYQWVFNGAVLPDATNSSLFLTNVQFENTGQYLVVASNELGVVTSTEAPLHVVSVAIWGGLPNPPDDLTNVVSIAGGYAFELALRRNGRITAWGSNSAGQNNVPSDLTNATAVSARSDSCLALRSDGTVAAWGSNGNGQGAVPAGLSNVVAVSAGDQHSLALRSDGTVLGWGLGSSSSNQPAGLDNVIAIATGRSCSLALRGDGSVASWGSNSQVTDVPAWLRDIVALAAGNNHALALKSDGTVIAWGANDSGQAKVPADLRDVVAIAAGSMHSLALKSDGTVTAWGAYSAGQTNVPADLHSVAAVNGGMSHSAALVGDGPPFLITPLIGRTVVHGSDASLFVAVSGAGPLAYQWRIDGRDIAGATNCILNLHSVSFSEIGRYSVVVSNAFGSIVSPEATLSVIPLRIAAQPQGTSTFRGDDVTLAILMDAQGPLVYQWRRNGEDLPGETQSVLTLSNVQPRQSGSYTVTVRNPVGSITSVVAAVSINDIALWADPYFDNAQGMTRAPTGLTNILAVAAGNYHSLALKQDGTVTAWGWNSDGQTNVPPGLSNVIAVAAGWQCSLALLRDGRVVGWGRNATPPNDLSNVVAIAAGSDYCLGLTAEGTVTSWGYYSTGVWQVPPGLSNVVAIAALSPLALTKDGRVVAWGSNYHGQTNVPPLTDAVAIGSGADFCAAVRANGSVVVWGDNQMVQGVPANLGGVVAIACGWNFVAALKNDGTVVLWGGFLGPPARLRNVVSIAAGEYHVLALVGDGPPAQRVLLSDPLWSPTGFSVAAPTRSGAVCLLEYKDSLSGLNWTTLPLVAGDGSTRRLVDPAASAASRFYRLRTW